MTEEQRDRRHPTRVETEGATAFGRRKVLLEILRAYPYPATVKELVPLMPSSQVVYEWPCPEPYNHEKAECIHARQTFTWTPGYANVYADLRLLEGRRLVARQRVGGQTLWAIYDPEDEEAEAIMSILEALS